MPDTVGVLLGIFIPFLGTALGAAMVFFLKKEMNGALQKALLGFAAGVMIAASVWSLLIPAIDMAQAAGQVALSGDGIAGHSVQTQRGDRADHRRPTVPPVGE